MDTAYIYNHNTQEELQCGSSIIIYYLFYWLFQSTRKNILYLLLKTLPCHINIQQYSDPTSLREVSNQRGFSDVHLTSTYLLLIVYLPFFFTNEIFVILFILSGILLETPSLLQQYFHSLLLTPTPINKIAIILHILNSKKNFNDISGNECSISLPLPPFQIPQKCYSIVIILLLLFLICPPTRQFSLSPPIPIFH